MRAGFSNSNQPVGHALHIYLFIYYINRDQSHRTEIQIIRAQTRMTNDKYSK